MIMIPTNQQNIVAVEVPQRNEGSQTHIKPHQPGVPGSGREVTMTSGCETSRFCGQVRQRAAGIPGIPLKGIHMDLESLTLSSRNEEAAQKGLGTCEEKLNGLASVQGLEGQLSPRQ